MGVMIGAGAAKTGSFLMRLGIEFPEEGDELETLAKTEGRNVTADDLFREEEEEDWVAGETEVRHQLLIAAVDIVHRVIYLPAFIPPHPPPSLR